MGEVAGGVAGTGGKKGGGNRNDGRNHNLKARKQPQNKAPKGKRPGKDSCKLRRGGPGRRVIHNQQKEGEHL